MQEIESLENIQASLFVNTSLKLSNDFKSTLQNELNINISEITVSDVNTTLEKVIGWLNPSTDFTNDTRKFVKSIIFHIKIQCKPNSQKILILFQIG